MIASSDPHGARGRPGYARPRYCPHRHGGGASSGERSFIPKTPADIENRTCHGRWVQACRAADLERYIVELFAVGIASARLPDKCISAARAAPISLTGASTITPTFAASVATRASALGWPRGSPVGDQPSPDPDISIFVMAAKAALPNRALRQRPTLCRPRLRRLCPAP